MLNFESPVWSVLSRNENKLLSFWPYRCSERVRTLAESISNGNSLFTISFTKSLLNLNALVVSANFRLCSICPFEAFLSKFAETYSDAKNNSCSTGSLKVISLNRPLTFVHSCFCVLVSAYAYDSKL